MKTSDPPPWQANDLQNTLRRIPGPKVTTVYAVVFIYNFVRMEGILLPNYLEEFGED